MVVAGLGQDAKWHRDNLLETRGTPHVFSSEHRQGQTQSRIMISIVLSCGAFAAEAMRQHRLEDLPFTVDLRGRGV